ncbi:hypothetical protein V5T82_17620 [Magnetovibrio sp. PR-2]|uniref:hypothetical protein n=1 Tax=Magnetovibrio sp. PR-2 TaxID=3120356 RepID=UPI002FCDFE80
MSDNTTTTTSVDTILETNQMVLEAYEMSTTESAGVVQDSNSMECIAKHYEQYVQNYQETWQAAWLDTITAYEKEVEGWQDAVSIFQAQTQAAAQSPTEPSANKSKSTGKSKAKSTHSKPRDGEDG